MPQALVSVYQPEQLAILDRRAIPQHVAVIMDGNRRWAAQKNLSLVAGHVAGTEALIRFVQAAAEIGIKTITAYSFSTENWGRSAREVRTLLLLLRKYLDRKLSYMIEQGVRFRTIGDIAPFPTSIRRWLQKCEEATAHCTTIEVSLALNYGARDELRRTVVALAQKVKEGQIDPQAITEQMITAHLDTAAQPDPALLIRTSGEYRMSNFLLWQLSYAELYFTRVLWPDFSADDLLAAIVDFQKRQRRFGE